MSFTINDSAAIEAIRLAYNAGEWTTAYDHLIDAITDADGDPLGDVPAPVAAWIQGARNVNAGQGALGDYGSDRIEEDSSDNILLSEEDILKLNADIAPRSGLLSRRSTSDTRSKLSEQILRLRCTPAPRSVTLRAA